MASLYDILFSEEKKSDESTNWTSNTGGDLNGAYERLYEYEGAPPLPEEQKQIGESSSPPPETPGDIKSMMRTLVDWVESMIPQPPVDNSNYGFSAGETNEFVRRNLLEEENNLRRMEAHYENQRLKRQLQMERNTRAMIEARLAEKELLEQYGVDEDDHIANKFRNRRPNKRNREKKNSRAKYKDAIDRILEGL